MPPSSSTCLSGVTKHKVAIGCARNKRFRVVKKVEAGMGCGLMGKEQREAFSNNFKHSFPLSSLSLP